MRAHIQQDNYLIVARCVALLQSMPFLGTKGSGSPQSAPQMPFVAESIASLGNKTSRTQKHSKIKDAPRLINVLVYLKDEYLQRDV